MNKNHRQTIALRNRKDEPIVVRVEPWGDEVTIQPGDVLFLHFEGPNGEPIEVETEPGALVVCGWVGSTVEIQAQTAAPKL